MIHYGISYHDARDFARKGRLNLDLPKNQLEWTDELKQECERLVEDSRNVSASPFFDSAKLALTEESKSGDENIPFGTEQVGGNQDEDVDEDEGCSILPHATLYLSIESSTQRSKKDRTNQERRTFNAMPSDCSLLQESLHEDETIQEDTENIEVSIEDIARYQCEIAIEATTKLASPESAIVSKTINNKPLRSDDESTKATEAGTEPRGVPSIIYVFTKVKEPPKAKNLFMRKVSKSLRGLGSKKASHEKVRFDVEEAEFYESQLVSL